MDHTALATARQILTVLGIDLDRVRSEPRSLRDILDAYIADLATRATPAHCDNVRARLRWLIDDLGVTHVHDIKPHTLLLHRARRLRAGSSVRTRMSLQSSVMSDGIDDALEGFQFTVAWNPECGQSTSNPNIRGIVVGGYGVPFMVIYYAHDAESVLLVSTALAEEPDV
jgi:hypothetical protein